jgi:hypothetical protein
MPIKIILNKVFFLLIFTVGTYRRHQSFKDNMSLRNHKTVEIMVYLNFFACR